MSLLRPPLAPSCQFAAIAQFNFFERALDR